MENDGEAGDNQGTGWCQVKKKHRTNSKSSIESSTNGKVGNLQNRQQPLSSKGGRNFATQVKVGGENSCSASKEADQGVLCLEKRVINQGTDVPENEKLDKIPKIKWGDLEDDTLAVYGCCGNSDKTSEIKCHDIVNDNLSAFGNSGNASLEDKKVLTYDDAEQFPDGMLSSAVKEETLEGNWKEVNEISSEDTGLPNLGGNMVSPNDSVGNLGEIHHESVEPSCNEVGDRSDCNTLATENCLSLPVEEIGMIMEPPGLNDKPEDGILDSFEVPVIGRAPVDALATAVVEEGKVLQDGLLNVDLSKSQLMSALGEGESGESKERFRQRLWCFLFENLNRAVDELYLLCELECDVEQMKEAVLVLEEAGFDFRELKSRVEGFENTKKSSSQPSKDGTPVTVKTDHRRPHALSWEVRRMTTSPHRAEILSSSLEAFKKIQQERASKLAPHSAKDLGSTSCTPQHVPFNLQRKYPGRNDVNTKSRKQTGFSDIGQGNTNGEKRNVEPNRLSKAYMLQNGRIPSHSLSTFDNIASQVSLKDVSAGKFKKEPLGSVSEMEKQAPKKDKVLTESKVEKHLKPVDPFKRPISHAEKEKEKRNAASWKSMDAWREKRNWEDILASPLRSSSRVSHSPGMSRKSVERARVLHDKLMSPEKKKKSSLDMKREAEEKHARAMRIRNELENERVQRLQRTSEKLNRVNEWQAVRSLKLREGMYARHQRSESRHEAYLAQVAKRAGDESSKVNEVRFITSLNEENKKLMLRQKLHDSELRRAEKLLVIKTKQKEDMAREEAVLERRKLIEAEKLQRLAEIQRKKEEAQVRREEERKASSAAREAKAVEQLRRKEVRAKAQQEEAELLAQKLAERLSESEQRRKFYLEQIREKASMDFRDQSSPSLRRSSIKEVQGRTVSTNSVDDYQAHCIPGVGSSALGIGNAASQHLLKRRIKKIRQRLMALKYEFTEPPIGAESAGIGYRALVGTARVKIGKWLQELQRLRQARKEGAASIGLIVGDMIKFLDGKDSELHASRQAGLIDFVAAALPASHTSRPEACQVTIYLLRLLRVVLFVPANRSYFLAQNLLPPIIPMLSAALENYIKIAASFNIPGSSNVLSSKTSVENMESIAEVLEGFLWTVTTIVGHTCSDERQLQMQDGLMELVISYQVIHRLRDLFALYDRPQVEGSPFPSSIMLSLNLLAVLTSRPQTISSIDWGAYLSQTAPDYKALEAKLVETAESINLNDSSVINTTIGDCRSQLSLQNMSTGIPLDEFGQTYGEENSLSDGVTLFGVPEDRSLAEPCRTSRHESLSSDWNPGKVHTDISVKIGDVGAAGQLCAASISGESHKNLIEPNQSSLFQKDEKNPVDISAVQNSRLQQDGRVIHTNNVNGQGVGVKQPVAFLLSVIAESGLVSLPSLLTAVLLQANSRLSSDQASYVLPSNFEEVATGVLKVLNNLALLDISLLQNMLARPDLKMEFFHLMSFLLSHCTSKWKAATDQVGLLLLESILLLGYFALFHPENQAVLRWGKSPTILHKVCDLPFVFFSDPELTPILAGTLVAVCYGCEQNRGVVQQELSLEMLLSLLKSCRYAIQSDSSTPENAVTDDRCDGNQTSMEPRKLQCDFPIKSGRGNSRNTRVSLGKAGVSGTRVISKARNQRDGKGTTRTCDEWALKHNLPASEASSTFMLHSRFPSGFIDRAEEFFSAATPSA